MYACMYLQGKKKKQLLADLSVFKMVVMCIVVDGEMWVK